MSDTLRLLRAAQSGDRESLESLYARHQGRLSAFICACMHPALVLRVAPEDVLQETLLESARKIAQFEPRGPASFYRWLIEIARFKIAEAERAGQALKRSLERPLDGALAASQTSVSACAVRSERADLVQQALAALPERQAEAVKLRYLAGLSLAETAARLGTSEAAIKALVGRGLAELATRIADSS